MPSSNSTPSSSGLEFVDHAPILFDSLRRHWGISAPVYLVRTILDFFFPRLSSQTSLITQQSSMGADGSASFTTIASPGKSGSQFYFSPDAKYVIKGINEEEFQFFSTNVYSYYEVPYTTCLLAFRLPSLVLLDVICTCANTRSILLGPALTSGFPSPSST